MYLYTILRKTNRKVHSKYNCVNTQIYTYIFMYIDTYVSMYVLFIFPVTTYYEIVFCKQIQYCVPQEYIIFLVCLKNLETIHILLNTHDIDNYLPQLNWHFLFQFTD